MDDLTFGRRFDLTNYEYDRYLDALADVEGLEGVTREAERQRQLLAESRRELHVFREMTARGNEVRALEIHALHVQIAAGEAEREHVRELASYRDALREMVQDGRCLCLSTDPFAEECPHDTSEEQGSHRCPKASQA